jgi:hypothetical protein
MNPTYMQNKESESCPIQLEVRVLQQSCVGLALASSRRTLGACNFQLSLLSVSLKGEAVQANETSGYSWEFMLVIRNVDTRRRLI